MMATDSLVFCYSEKMAEEGGNLRNGHPRIVTPSKMEESSMKIDKTIFKMSSKIHHPRVKWREEGGSAK